MPVISQTKTNSGATLALWQLSETEEELLALVPDREAEAATVAAFSAPRRRREYLATRALLAAVAGPAFRIAHEASGKPYLVANAALVPNISISHTDGYVAVILHPTRPVAVDIEVCSPRALRLAPRFLSAIELNAIRSHEELCATLAWSAKETLFKRIGVADVDFRDALLLRGLDVSDINTSDNILQATVSHPRHHADYTISYRVAPDYVLTWIE
jgi:phosphopantetheinyl transferase